MAQKEQNKKDSPQNMKSYAQYYGMAFQIFGLLIVSMLIGMKLDSYFNNDTNYIAAILTVVVLVAYLYKVVYTLSQKQ
jgi:F0F1-type ATP synthase assembly protein I